MISKLPYYGLGLYLIGGIFYLFPSGMPQPADFGLLLTMVVGFVLWQRVPREVNIYLALGLLCTWIYLVNAFYFARFGDATFLIKTAFYLYNSLVLIFVLFAAYRDWPTLCAVVRWACVIALFAQLAHVLLVPAYTVSGVRAVGTFHNPNQLGYWALLAMGILAITKDRRPFNAIDLAAIGAGGYAILTSLSKAALGSGILMIILLFAFQGIRRGPAIIGALAAISAVAFSQLQGNTLEKIAEWDLSTKLEHRVTHAQTDDNIANRGYRVIWDNPHYWALGSGEGHYRERFKPTPKNSEVHSSLGNVFLSYGMVGLGFFFVLLWVVFKRSTWAARCYFVPIMMYSMVHMGLRFSEFWIFLALAYAQTRWSTSYEVSKRPVSYVPERNLSQRRDDHPERRSGIRNGGGEGRRPIPSRRDVSRVCRAGPYGGGHWCDRS